jgi:nicotinate dehydrogenase subunit A
MIPVLFGSVVLSIFASAQDIDSGALTGPRDGYMIFYSISADNSKPSPRLGSLGMPTIRLTVNSKSYTVDADPQTSLLSALREQLDLTGSKYGCGEGQCGACTVLIDGKAQRSCVTKVVAVSSKQITTVEGLASGDQLHPVQAAFLEADAMQCGYCTSGMIMSAVALLQRNPSPNESEIVQFMDGNVCRCGTYPRIVRAIQKAAKSGTASSAAKGAGR